MEILKSGDVPDLVTNIEVLNILAERINKRRETDAAFAERNGIDMSEMEKKRRTTGKLRHRDYIEERVHDYLVQSPIAKLDMSTLPDLVSTLRRKESSKIHRKNQNGGEGQKEEHANDDENGTGNGENDKQDASVLLEGFGLTDSETLQILNHMPTEPVEIHLLIEDLSSRMDEDRQNQLLQLISEHSVVEEYQDFETQEEDSEYVEQAEETLENNPDEAYI
mmetsp:Transcript_14832/g.21216  ORF Transcript_14832/g.21216 Transcript_14832/m.21216 type:complete len:222 (-) Transcript_14832:29-694(-)